MITLNGKPKSVATGEVLDKTSPTMQQIKTNGIRPNPKWKPTKSGKSSKPRFLVNQNVDVNGPIFNDIYGSQSRSNSSIYYDSTDYQSSEEIRDTAKSENIGQEVKYWHTDDDVKYNLYKNQSNGEMLARWFGRLVFDEIALGIFKGAADLTLTPIGMAIDKIQDDSLDYTNPVSELLESWQDALKKEWAFYSNPYDRNDGEAFNFNSGAWWAENTLIVGSTIVIGAVTWGAGNVAKGLASGASRAFANLASKSSKVAKLAKAGSNVSKGVQQARKALSANKLGAKAVSFVSNNKNTAMQAFTSRTLENIMEARGVYKEMYDETLNTYRGMSNEERKEFFKNNPNLVGKSDEEIAKYVAGKSADETFINDYGMFVTDLLQYNIVNKFGKAVGVSQTANASTRRANIDAIDRLANNGAISVKPRNWSLAAKSKEILKHSIKNPIQTLSSGFTGLQILEALEEVYQGIQTEEGKDVGRQILDGTYNARTMRSYIEDPHIWEQGMFGALGGIIFGNTVKGLSAAKRKFTNTHANKHLSYEKQREVEINSRFDLLNNYNEKIERLNNGFSTLPSIGEDGKPVKDENGDFVYDKISEKQIEEERKLLIDDLAVDLAFNAADAGNADLLREFTHSDNMKQYFQNKGYDTTIHRELNEAVNKHLDEYQKELQTTVSYLPDANDYVVRAIARQKHKDKVLDNYYGAQQNVQEAELNEALEKLREDNPDITNDDIEILRNEFRKSEIKRQLNDIENLEAKTEQEYSDGVIDEVVYRNRKRAIKEAKYNIGRFAKDALSVQSDDLLSEFEKALDDFWITHDATPVEGEAGISAFMARLKSFIENSSHSYSLDADGQLTWVNHEDKLNELHEKLAPVKPYIEALERTSMARRNHNLNTLKTARDYKRARMDFDKAFAHQYRVKQDNAFKAIEDYIKEVDDLDVAYTNLLSGNYKNDAIREAVEFLKLGVSTQSEYDALLLATIEKEKEDRVKRDKESNTNTVNGKEARGVNTTTSEQLRQDNSVEAVTEDVPFGNESSTEAVVEPVSEHVDATNQNVTPPETEVNEQQQEQTSTSTGVEEKAQPTDVDIDATEPKGEEEAVFVPEQKEVDRLRELSFSVPISVKRDILNALEANGIYEAIANSNSSLDVRNRVKEIISEANPNIEEEAIEMAISDIVSLMRRDNAKGATKFIDMYKQALAKAEGKLSITEVINDAKTHLREVFTDFVNDYVKNALTNPNITSVYRLGNVIKVDGVALMRDIYEDETIPDNIKKDLYEAIYNLTIGNTQYKASDEVKNLFPNKIFGIKHGSLIDRIEITNRDVIQDYRKNPSKFYETLENSTVDFSQNQMRFRRTNNDRSNKELRDKVNKAIEYAKKNANSLRFTQHGKSISINVEMPNSEFVEIGYIATVTLSGDNNVYNLDGNKGTISWNLSEKDNDITSSLDSLFKDIIDFHSNTLSKEDEKAMGEFIQFLNYISEENGTYINKGHYDNIYTFDKIQEIINNKYFKQFVENINGAFEYKDGQLVGINKEAIRPALIEVHKIYTNILKEGSKLRMQASYNLWKKTLLNGYKQTKNLQDHIAKGNKEGVSFTSGTLVAEDMQRTNTSETPIQIKDLNLNESENPFVYFTQNGAVDAKGNPVKTNKGFAGTHKGQVGFVIGENRQGKLIGTFENVNKVDSNSQLGQALIEEVSNILDGFQSGKLTFEEASIKLQNIFIGSKDAGNLFKGITVYGGVKTDYISLGYTNGDTFVPILKLYKYKQSKDANTGQIKKSDKRNTTIVVNVKGKDYFYNNASEAIRKNIAGEIIKHTSHNISFYNLNHNVDNYSVEHSIVKRVNGKMVVELGGKTFEYSSYLDYLSKENAVVTYYNRNENGSFLTTSGFNQGLFIDVKSVTVKPIGQRKEDKSSYYDFDRKGNGVGTKSNKLKAKAKNGELTTKDVFEAIGVPQPIIEQWLALNFYVESYKYEETNKNVNGYYDPVSNEITITDRNFGYNKKTGYRPFARLLTTIVHENLHRALYNQNTIHGNEYVVDELNKTIDYVEQYVTNSENITEENKKLFEAINNLINKLRTQYGANTDVLAEEWLVETLSNRALTNFLKGLEYKSDIKFEGVKDGTIWDRIVDVIFHLFGINRSDVKKESVLQHHIDVISKNIISNNAISEVSLENQDNSNDDVNTNDDTVSSPVEGEVQTDNSDLNTETDNTNDNTSSPVEGEIEQDNDTSTENSNNSLFYQPNVENTDLDLDGDFDVDTDLEIDDVEETNDTENNDDDVFIFNSITNVINEDIDAKLEAAMSTNFPSTGERSVSIGAYVTSKPFSEQAVVASLIERNALTYACS